MTLEQLRAALQKAIGALETFNEGIVDEEGNPRDYTEEEVKTLEDLTKEVEKANRAYVAKESSDRAIAAVAVPAGKGTVPAQPREEKKLFGSFGEFLSAVASDAFNKGDPSARDPRLIYQRIAGAGEAVPSDGGFLVQTDHVTSIFDLMHEMGAVLARCRKLGISTNANAVDLPAIDETSRAQGSRFGGIRAYWAAEGDSVTDSKPKFRKIELKLNKLMGVGYATDEILQDSALLEGVMKRAFAEELTFETEDAVINGNGSGKPLGIVNSGALISVAAESGQAASTIRTENVINMWDRLPVRSRRNAVWLIADGQIEPQLFTMTLPNSNANIYKLPDQNAATPNNTNFGNLLGRPVIPTEYNAALGSVGDIMLVDLDQYLLIDKGGVNAAESMHVRFLTDEMTFRVTYRVDGQPIWNSAVTTANSGITKSPFIALAAR